MMEIMEARSAPPGQPGSGRIVRRPPFKVQFARHLSWLTWRYRYLGMFVLIGFLSICLEVAVVVGLGEASGHLTMWGSLIGFLAGMLFAFYGNFRFNFRVEKTKFWRTFGLFACISCCSYCLNLVTKDWLNLLNWHSYPMARFITSGSLFIVAYTLHRRFTFRRSAKDFGLAVYAAQGTDVQALYQRIGEHCDHIHIDLVDESCKPDAEPVDTAVIAQARAYWTWQPFMIHIMSRRPRRWVDACLEHVDVVLVHIDGDEDVLATLAECRLRGKAPGVVAHHSVTLAQLMPYLPHCDYVLMLGIERPGYSGQPMMASAMVMAKVLAAMSDRYGFRLIFDGGVTIDNVNHIPADYIVSSTTVLHAEDPTRAALALMSGLRNARD
jgi:pentose-5-phosphate-3-epimerase/putative flippase GtrA